MKLDQSWHERREARASCPQGCLDFFLHHRPIPTKGDPSMSFLFKKVSSRYLHQNVISKLKQPLSQCYIPKMCLSLWREGMDINILHT